MGSVPFEERKRFELGADITLPSALIDHGGQCDVLNSGADGLEECDLRSITPSRCRTHHQFRQFANLLVGHDILGDKGIARLSEHTLARIDHDPSTALKGLLIDFALIAPRGSN